MRVVVSYMLAVVPALAAVDFKTQIGPILTRECVGCHGADRGLGGFRLQSRDAALKGNAVVPGKPESSLAYIAIERKPGQTSAMPPGHQLSAPERQLIRQWIAEGAAWPSDAA